MCGKQVNELCCPHRDATPFEDDDNWSASYTKIFIDLDGATFIITIKKVLASSTLEEADCYPSYIPHQASVPPGQISTTNH